MSPKYMAVRTPRELQLDRFLRVIRENGNEQLVDEFLAAFSEIAPPVHPNMSAATTNVARETHVLRGFWVPAERTYVGVKQF
jgi:hypothetical protein